MDDYVYKSIKITNLLLNLENPRFDPVNHQREAILVMVRELGEELINLAKHVINYGLNPSDLIIVVPFDRNGNLYKVIEGNRRVTALKMLYEPNLIPEDVHLFRKKFLKLCDEFKSNPITEVDCVVYNEEDKSNIWVSLKHTGKNEGIGIVKWNSEQKKRFERRFKNKKDYSLQVIDFVKQSDVINRNIKEKLKDISITNLERLVSDPYIRQSIGLKLEKGIIKTDLPASEIAKGLSKIITDLSMDDFTVDRIKKKEHRKKYIQSFEKEDLPDFTKSTREYKDLAKLAESEQDINGGENITGEKKEIRTTRRKTIERKKVIPYDCKISINDPRINNIYHELKKIDVDDFPNSVAVLFRVFIELCVDSYIQQYQVKCKGNKTLAQKIEKVGEDMLQKNLISEKEIRPIRVLVSSKNNILSIDTFHEYVHNRHFHPVASDLKAVWDNVEIFINKIWN